jgi:hypothetical protein
MLAKYVRPCPKGATPRQPLRPSRIEPDQSRRSGGSSPRPSPARSATLHQSPPRSPTVDGPGILGSLRRPSNLHRRSASPMQSPSSWQTPSVCHLESFSSRLWNPRRESFHWRIVVKRRRADSETTSCRSCRYTGGGRTETLSFCGNPGLPAQAQRPPHPSARSKIQTETRRPHGNRIFHDALTSAGVRL